MRRNDRFVHYAMAATKQALDDSGFSLNDENADDVGVIIGSGIGGLRTCHDQFRVLFEKGPDRVSPFFITMFITDIAAGLRLACSSARAAPTSPPSPPAPPAPTRSARRAEMIRRGDAIAMMAGGAEAGITPMGLASFGNMHALSRRNDDPASASRPFDAERDGFVMGEGAGVLMLEDEEHARARGARIYAELAGYAATADAHHITEPAPWRRGTGARHPPRAPESVSIAPEDVQYINAHGTGTMLQRSQRDRGDQDGLRRRTPRSSRSARRSP